MLAFLYLFQTQKCCCVNTSAWSLRTSPTANYDPPQHYWALQILPQQTAGYPVFAEIVCWCVFSISAKRNKQSSEIQKAGSLVYSKKNHIYTCFNFLVIRPSGLNCYSHFQTEQTDMPQQQHKFENNLVLWEINTQHSIVPVFPESVFTSYNPLHSSSLHFFFSKKENITFGFQWLHLDCFDACPTDRIRHHQPVKIHSPLL